LSIAIRPTQGFGFFKIMRGQDDRVPIAIQAPNELPQALPKFDVDPGSRFVKNNDWRFMHQCLGDENPALHAAGQTTHIGISLGGQIQVGENLVDPAFVVANSKITGLNAQGLTYRKERVKNEFLWHHPEQAPGGAVIADHIMSHHDQFAGTWARETGQAGNQGSLAGTVGPQQTKELSLADLQ
jgi:hypothetical protein